MNLADNALKTLSVDSLLNYETVKYYCGEEFEVDRYRNCVLAYQVCCFSFRLIRVKAPLPRWRI